MKGSLASRDDISPAMSIKLVPFLFSFLSFLSSFLRPSFHLICLQNNSASSSTVTWTVRCTLIAFSLWKPRPVLLPRGDIATRMWYGPQKNGRLWCFFASRPDSGRSCQQACFAHCFRRSLSHGNKTVASGSWAIWCGKWSFEPSSFL